MVIRHYREIHYLQMAVFISINSTDKASGLIIYQYDGNMKSAYPYDG